MTKKLDPYRTGQVNAQGAIVCGAKKRNGDPCMATPKKGHTRCHRHGGGSPRSKQAAKRRNAETAAREILGTIDPDAPREHPVETLLNLIQAKAAEVAWLRSIVKEQTEEQLVWGEAEHQEGIGPMGVVDVKTFKAEQHPYWKLLREAENQLASWTERAARAGVEERSITLAESHASLITTALNRVFAALHLNSEQQKLIPQVVPGILRELGEGATA